MKYIDNFLDSITMYRLVLYVLTILAVFAILFGFLGIISYSGLDLLASLTILCFVCYVSNYIFTKLFKAYRNVESAFITAFILFFLLLPGYAFSNLKTLVLAGVLAMASKYILAINKKHIFNPAAISIFILTLFNSSSVLWWVGTGSLLPVTAILGFFILRKLNRFRYFGIFFLLAFVTTWIFVAIRVPMSVFSLFGQFVVSFPTIFFGVIMLTEPLTSPATKNLRYAFAAIVGIFYGAQFHFGPIYSTPELALILGNIFAYIAGPKYKSNLIFKTKNNLAKNVYEFVFESKQKLKFRPGQYLEWTLPHQNSDSRGIRRYFTVASSPTEPTIKLAVRFDPEKGSTFKKALLNMREGESILVSYLSGDFVLPKNENQKLVFIAGGIGITPFKSMIQSLIDKNERRDITLIYSNRTPDDVIYKNFFDQAENIGLKIIYAFPDWQGDISLIPNAVKNIDENVVKKIPDYRQNKFYISGPPKMVDHFEEFLKSLGVSSQNIITDFFPGY